MAEKIIWFAVTLGCAALFFGIGVFAERSEKPMWFWAGSTVDPAKITDVKRYNKENGIMWQVYSLFYVASAVAEIWSSLVAVILLVITATVGTVPLIFIYNRIYRKYKKND